MIKGTDILARVSYYANFYSLYSVGNGVRQHLVGTKEK